MKGQRRPHINPLIVQQALQKLLAVCPFCQTTQGEFTTSVVDEANDAELIHVRCQSCKAAMVALLFTTGPMISSIGMLTDLTLEDVSHFQRQRILSEDDLLALHEFLSQPVVVDCFLKLNKEKEY